MSSVAVVAGDPPCAAMSKIHCTRRAFRKTPLCDRYLRGPDVRRHWSDSHLYMSSDELSIELPLDDVLRIAGALSLGCFGRVVYTLLRAVLCCAYDAEEITL